MESMEINNNSILKKFKNKKVFITGHTGFKGAWLSFILDSCGAIVKGYSLKPQNEKNLFNSIEFSNNFISEYGDINDYEKFKNSISVFSPDYIFHLAAQSLVIESYINPYYTFQTNFNGTLNLLEIIRTLNFSVKVIFITSDKVYKNSEKGEPFIEDDRLGGNDPYSASKSTSELLINSYVKSFFEKNNRAIIVTARAGNVIGGGDFSENRLIPDIIRSIESNTQLIIRNPNSIRPWQHVLEPLFGYLKLALNISKFHGESFNFGPEQKDEKKVLDVLNTFSKYCLFNYQIIQNEYPESELLKLNILKAKNQLHWVPKWDSEKAIEITFKFYMKSNLENANVLMLKDINEYLNY